MRRFTSPSFIFDATVTLRRCEERAKTMIICTFSFTTQRISFRSQTKEQGEILCKKLNISYIDQFVVPPTLNYLIEAKDVDIEEWQAGQTWIHGWPAIARPSLDVGPSIDGLDPPLVPNTCQRVPVEEGGQTGEGVENAVATATPGESCSSGPSY